MAHWRLVNSYAKGTITGAVEISTPYIEAFFFLKEDHFPHYAINQAAVALCSCVLAKNVLLQYMTVGDLSLASAEGSQI